FKDIIPKMYKLKCKSYEPFCSHNLGISIATFEVLCLMRTMRRRSMTLTLRRKKARLRPSLYIMDPDHRLLLRNTKPLLQSRNTAVVMSVAQLYWHLAPKHEVSIVTKSLVRLLRSHREVQYIVLQNIATMSIQRKNLIDLYLSFYHNQLLEILTNLANEANISTILREFQTYVKSQDKAFAAATIQAIGRCATNISEVTDTCLNGLVLLLSNRDETVVAESVVVIKKLLQTQPTQHSEIIKHMAKLFDNITVPMARASILWLMGEYCERVPKIAPDVLRKMAKTFTIEEDIVKLQTVNLAAKLYLTNSKQTKLLTQYILNLGKYDQNYDIRDRTRFIRQLIVPSEKNGALNKYARRILLAPKPAPVLESAFKDRDRYQLGTLSHSLNIKATGYQELSDWPAVAPDQSVRNVEVIEPVKEWAPLVGKAKQTKSDDKFYSDDEDEKEEEGSDSSGSEDSSSSSSSSSSSEGLFLSLCSKVYVTTPSFGPVKTYELLHHMTGKGLSAKYHFPRQPCLYQPSMVAVQVILTNGSDHSLEEIHIGDRNPASLNIHCFNTIERLEPEASVTVSMGIDFSDSTQAANFQLCTKEDQFNVSIQPAVGELLMPSSMTEQDFCKEQGKLLGMNETSGTITMATANASSQAISKQVLSVANVGVVSSSQNNFHRFAGQTVSSGALVLVSLEVKESSSALLTINTEKSVMASMLLRDLKQALAQA
uniref:Adaptor related protein complex 3 subunit beta 1 n=1 Tax=Lates calcarifer TaxID=8187 RepID=A0A4W6DCQ3_LATCA